MKLSNRSMLSIVVEAALESMIIKDIKRLGGRGYTIIDAHGEGARGVRKGDWDQNRNILFNVLCTEEIGHSIMDFLYETYYEDYAIVTYMTDVKVHRENKF